MKNKDNPFACNTPEYQRVWYLVKKKGLSTKEAVERVRTPREKKCKSPRVTPEKEPNPSEEPPNIFTNCQYLLIIGHLKRIDENQNKIMSKLGLKPPSPGPAAMPGGEA